MTLRVGPVTSEAAAYVAANMREADRDEVWASSHMTPEQSIRESLRVSTQSWAGYHDGVPICICGVAPLNMIAGTGSPWLLGTDAMASHSAAFLRRCRPYVARMLAVYPTLVNHVDDRNEASKRWLQWLGFDLGEPEPHGPDGVLFRPFKLEVPNV